MGELSFLHRLLVGDAPWSFLFEVGYRAVVIYLFLLVFLRLHGKLLTAQLGIAELAVLLLLGAAISAPIQVPTQGMLTAIVVMACIVALQRGLAWWAVRNQAVTHAIQGTTKVLIEDGALLLDKLDQVKISHETLLSQLRAQGIGHLGQLRRAYLEPSGQISLVRWRKARPGLPLYPGQDDPFTTYAPLDDLHACMNCGHVQAVASQARGEDPPCGRCGRQRWRQAVR
jgi:uncharacterized membrane protein YcaP (DUF421 family)